MARRDGASVVLVGSSMMNAAGDPTLLARLIGGKRRPVFNAALAGGTGRLLNLWTLGVVVPRLRPRLVVIGVSSRELNDLGKAGSFASIRASYAGRRLSSDLSVQERLLTRAERLSYAIRYRAILRTPSRWFRSDAGRPLYRVGPHGESTRSISKLDRPYPTVDQLLAEDPALFRLNPYAVGGHEIGAIRNLAMSLIRKKIRVLIVEMPVSQDVVRFHEHGAEDYHNFEQALVDMVSRNGIDFLNLAPAFPDTSTFVDPQHVNRAGRERFTGLLAGPLRARLADG